MKKREAAEKNNFLVVSNQTFYIVQQVIDWCPTNNPLRSMLGMLKVLTFVLAPWVCFLYFICLIAIATTREQGWFH